MERQKKTFKKLKKRFTKELMLIVPDLDEKMETSIKEHQVQV